MMADSESKTSRCFLMAPVVFCASPALSAGFTGSWTPWACTIKMPRSCFWWEVAKFSRNAFIHRPLRPSSAQQPFSTYHLHILICRVWTTLAKQPWCTCSRTNDLRSISPLSTPHQRYLWLFAGTLKNNLLASQIWFEQYLLCSGASIGRHQFQSLWLGRPWDSQASVERLLC